MVQDTHFTANTHNIYGCFEQNIVIYMIGFLTKAGSGTHNKQIHFPPPVDSFIYQQTTDGYFTVHSSSICFSMAYFCMWPVCMHAWCLYSYMSALNVSAWWWLTSSPLAESLQQAIWILMSGVYLATF